MKDVFRTYHPFVNFFYFVSVIGFSMFLMHPVCMALSLISAWSYALYQEGRKAVVFNLKFTLPLMLVMGLMNPAFNHEGQTILTYLDNGNPVTLESVLYGVAAASMMGTVIIWFSCYNKVMTSDKFIYLFGKIIPAMSLVISMALRFVPRFKHQLQVITRAQRCIGRDVRHGRLWQRMKNALAILSILMTWAFENAIETGDSMRSRGYGLTGRTAFSIYRFDGRDRRALFAEVLTVAVVLVGSFSGVIQYRYFPSFKGEFMGPAQVLIYLSYLILLNLPMMLNRMEDRKWKTLESNI